MVNKSFSKRLFSTVLALLMVAGLALPAAAASGEQTLVIVHTNDVHARVDGEAFVSTYVKERKKAGENVLLLSAGDVLHGQNLATLSQGKAVVDIMNATGYDAATTGNHEYNYGIKRLIELKKDMNYNLLVANLVTKGTNKPVFTPYVIKDVGGIKVGIFGLATPETATKTNPKNVEGYEFLKPVPVAKQMTKELKEKGADVIIALSHLGVDEETLKDERSTAIADIEGIDIVVDGHSHTEMPTGKKGKYATIVQTGEYLNNFGVAELKINSKGVSSISAKLVKTPKLEEGKTSASGNLQPDANVLKIINDVKAANEKITSQVIGQTPVKLVGEREIVRSQESNLGNLLADAMIAATGADVAITNGGGIRESIEAGKITKGDVLTVLPFGNYIVTLNVKGSVIQKALEHGLDTTPEPAGHYSQIGGMKVEFDSSKPAGKRIVSVTLNNGKALDQQKTYTLATNDFMAVGGDEYDMFKGAPGFMVYGSLDDALIDYLSKGANIEKVSMGRAADVKGKAKTTETKTTETKATETKTETTAPAATGKVYIVKEGDYLYKIAREHGTTWKAIAQANNLKDPNIIIPGQELKIA